MRSLRIRDHRVGDDRPPFIIAEMSGNHNQSLQRALEIVDAAADCGVHALKLQTYTADTMTLDIREGEFVINDETSPWHGRSLYELYEEAHTPWEWHGPIFRRAAERGLIAFSTPFDATAVDFLEDLDAPAYKVASFENTDLPLIRKIASTGKPMILSTGTATAAEIDTSVRAARAEGCEDLVLLQCTSTYPASPENSNLRTIPHMRELFDVQVGLSDHTLGIGVAVASVALGATVIEKHFTLSRDDGGVDAAFSLEPAEMRALVEESKRAWSSLGHVVYGPKGPESKSLRYRRSLYIVEDLEPGDVLTEVNVRAIRPGSGLAPAWFSTILGMSAKRAVKRGTPLSWELVS